jgi:hypothetical protein
LAPGELGSLAERGRPYDDPVIEARLDRLGFRP